MNEIHMKYPESDFIKEYLLIKNINIIYYLSPLLNDYEFTHAFFSKRSWEFRLDTLGNFFKNNNKNCFTNQIHSNSIITGSELYNSNNINADGIVGDKSNQNLWIYSADCMPILFADKSNRKVAAIHCGRKGIEKKIIIKSINLLEKLGSLRKNLLVSIGPSISMRNYNLNKQLLQKFHDNIKAKETKFLSECEIKEKVLNLHLIIERNSQRINLRKHAYLQLINENIQPQNIEISNLCTFETHEEFHSWRRSKTIKRQWSFISS